MQQRSITEPSAVTVAFYIRKPIYETRYAAAPLRARTLCPVMPTDSVAEQPHRAPWLVPDCTQLRHTARRVSHLPSDQSQGNVEARCRRDAEAERRATIFGSRLVPAQW
jgi:hypothetical protein